MVPNMSVFWLYQGHEYASGSEYGRVLSKPGFWISQVSEYTKVLNMHLVMNLPGFWVHVWFWICQGSEYVRVTLGSEYAWIAFVLYFPIVIPCLLEGVVTYFNVFTKLEVLFWMKMRLFSWRDTAWFSSFKYFIWFLF